MLHGKKSAAGVAERLRLHRDAFPRVDEHLAERPRGVGPDDLLDAAAAAWTGVRFAAGIAETICAQQRDAKGLITAIRF
jgi:predicted RNase H-like nuclease